MIGTISDMVGRQADLALQVGRHIAEQGVIHHIQRDDQATELQDRPPVTGDQVLELGRGLLLLFAPGLQLTEYRGVLQPGAQVDADQAERGGDQERQPPTPRVHLVVTEHQRESEHQQRTDRESGQRAELEEAAEETAPAARRVFRHERRGAAVLAAGGEALDHPQQHQQDRRPQPDRGIARHEPDAQRRASHHQDGERQHALAPDPVTRAGPRPIRRAAGPGRRPRRSSARAGSPVAVSPGKMAADM